MKRIGKRSILFKNCPSIAGFAACVGKKEGEGPLREYFDKVFDDDMLGQQSWEQAESMLQKEAFMRATEKSGHKSDKIDTIFAGDLLNQCTASAFGFKGQSSSYLGQYGACSTMAQTLLLASVFCSCGASNCSAAVTSSHFCSAERQFRNPLDYGGQRPPTAQWTVTGSGAVIVDCNSSPLCIKGGTFGKITDLGITDANNMGAAMAPAAAETISDFLGDVENELSYPDLILTGDLGKIGSGLLIELLNKNGMNISAIHKDCGTMIYDLERQDVHAGGSGCGCSASVLCGKILPDMLKGHYRSVLFVGTGALQSPTSIQQGETMPAIAHAVLIERKE